MLSEVVWGLSSDQRQVLVQRYLSEQYTARAAGEHADVDDDADVGAARPGRCQRAASLQESPTGDAGGGTSTAAFALQAYACLLRAGFVADRASTVRAWGASFTVTSLR
jgi:hypothetical protein